MEVRLPLPASECLQAVALGPLKNVPWEPVAGAANVARIPLPSTAQAAPVLLDLEYKVAAASLDGTQACACIANAGVSQRSRDGPYVLAGGFAAGADHAGIRPHSCGLDYLWGWQGWLPSPAPAFTASELEAWLTQQEPSEAAPPLSLTFARPGVEPLRLYHVPRQVWLTLCSAGLLLVGMAILYLPLPRWSRWLGLLLAFAARRGGLLRACLRAVSGCGVRAGPGDPDSDCRRQLAVAGTLSPAAGLPARF